MKNLIKRILKEEYNKKEHDICNMMTVDTYEEGIKLLEKYLGTIEENPVDWSKIKKPLKMWKDSVIEIRTELGRDCMTGDSEVDESDTWWATIQGSFCK